MYSQANKTRLSSNSNLYSSMVNYYNKPNKRIPLVYINVFCRFRPPSEQELEHTTNNCITILSPKQLLVRKDNNLDIQQDYTFDGLFLPLTPLDQIYTRTTKQIVENVLMGYNGAVICYGQTGTGKTYTMNEITPIAVNQIFNGLSSSNKDNEIYKIEVSIIEIYKEQVNDILDPKKTNLNLIENKLKKKNLTIENLTSINVTTENELNDIIYKGTIKRNTNSSTMKEYTAKSHNIIIITIYRYYKDKNCLNTGTLYLCDLEGSEKITKMNPVEGENIEEQKLVNKSLSALASVVQSLSVKNDTIFHVPYRDSKLTRILSECLGGSAYTTLILTCTQNEYNLSETRNTLLFGERAKKIRNKPVINIELNADKNPIIKELLNKRNEEENNFDEKERIAQKNAEIKRRYENEIYDLKNQIKQLKENRDMDLNVIQELKENINILESDKQNLKSTKEKLMIKENELKDMNKKIKDLKKKSEKDEEIIEKLKGEGNKLRKANDNIKYLEMEKENYIQQVEEKENEIKNLEENMREKEQNLEKLNSELEDKKTDIKSLQIKYDKMEKDYINQINNKSQIMKELENNIEAEKNEKKKQIKLNQELNDNLTEANNKINNYENKIKEQSRYMKNNNNEIEELKNEILNLKKKIETLEKAKQDLIKEHGIEVDKLQKEIFNLKSVINKLKSELKSKDNNMLYLNEEKEKLEKIKEDYITEIKEKESEIQNKTNQLNNLKDEIQQKNNLINNTDNKLKYQNNNINDLNKRLIEKKEDNEKLSQEIRQLKNAISDKDFENEKLQKTILELTQELNTTKEKSENKITSLETQIDDMEKKIKTNKGVIEQSDTKIKTLQKEMNQKKDEFNREIKKLNTKNIELNNKLEISNKKEIENESNKQKTEQNLKIFQDELKRRIIVIEDLKKKNENFLNDINNNKSKISKLTEENNSLQDELIKLRKELDNSKRDNIKQKQENNNNKEEKSNLIKSIELLKQKNNLDLKSYEETIQRQVKEINDLSQSLANLNSINQQQTFELQKTKETVEDLEKENEELYHRMQDYEEIKTELNLFKDREQSGGNFVFKEINKSKLKIEYENLLLENQQLKDKIKQLEQYNE